jgi:hypothetical protein
MRALIKSDTIEARDSLGGFKLMLSCRQQREEEVWSNHGN